MCIWIVIVLFVTSMRHTAVDDLKFRCYLINVQCNTLRNMHLNNVVTE